MRAHITIRRRGNVVALTDENDGAMSITNDAEGVVAWLIEHGCFYPAADRLIYRDTDGVWDELSVARDGEFIGFKPLRERSLDGALASLAVT